MIALALLPFKLLHDYRSVPAPRCPSCYTPGLSVGVCSGRSRTYRASIPALSFIQRYSKRAATTGILTAALRFKKSPLAGQAEQHSQKSPAARRNLLVFPKGNNGRSSLSVYLNVPDTDGPYGWHRRAKFVLILLNRDPAKNIVKGGSLQSNLSNFCFSSTYPHNRAIIHQALTYLWCCADTEHLFEGKENDWGFTQFTQLSDLDEAHGFVQDDCLKLQVKITVEHPDSYLYNSKRETGFVGLKNQGATCYMNSLLQTLYNINFFRQVCYCL